MDHLFDEFSKSLAESLPRRESLRRIGAVFAGALLAPLGLGTAWAGKVDPCVAFCKCRIKADQTKCLAACKACSGDTKRIAGACGSHTCCAKASCGGKCSDLKSDPNCGACGHNCRALGETCCGNYCADLAHDVFNCGRCGIVCGAAGPYEFAACVSGHCIYDCVNGAVDCGNGTCTHLGFDPDNCGACGSVCGGSTPFCTHGTCTQTYCNGADLNWDSNNCGECGFVCPEQFACEFGVCEGIAFN